MSDEAAVLSSPQTSPIGAEASSSTETAPWKHLPKHTFGAIEYPGPVRDAANLLNVVSQNDINECFNAPLEQQPILEMSYRREDKAAVPVRGQRVPSQKLLLRIVKRKRRGNGSTEEQGVFTATIQGSVTQTVRFRSMADFHYTPNPEGRIQGLLAMLRDLDYESILDYNVPELDEVYEEVIPPEPGHEDEPPRFRSTLDLQPPPVFFERRLPQIHHWKNHPQAYEEELQDPRTGEIRRRLANRTRFTGQTLIKIGHSHSAGEVPREPHPSVQSKLERQDKLGKEKLDPVLVDKLHRLFEERPVWLRTAILAQFTPDERKAILTNRLYLPSQSYSFGAGPFWKCLVRLGYDPVHDPAAHKYQRTYFYVSVGSRVTIPNPLREPTPEAKVDEEDERTSRWWEAEQQRLIAEGKRPPLDRSREHIFDGQMLHRDRPDYQFCDITDPLIRQYLDDPNNRKDECDPRDGWFKPAPMQLIKNILRIKYMHIRSTCTPAPDSLCYDVIKEYHHGTKAEDAGPGAGQGEGQGAGAEGDDVEMGD